MYFAYVLERFIAVTQIYLSSEWLYYKDNSSSLCFQGNTKISKVFLEFRVYFVRESSYIPGVNWLNVLPLCLHQSPLQNNSYKHS